MITRIEYTYNELENEAVQFTVDGKTLVSMGGPEETRKPGIFWGPAMDNGGASYDLYWLKSGDFGGWDFYTLQSAEVTCLE